MKKILTISERGELAQQLQSNEHFYTDIKLYNEFFPGSKLSSQLAKANEHNMPSLHSRMLYDLLSQVDQEDILSNRKPVEANSVIEIDLEKQAEANENTVSQIRVLMKNQHSIDVIRTTFASVEKVGEKKLTPEFLDELIGKALVSLIDQDQKSDTNVDDTKVDETNVDDTKVDENKVDETNVDETKVDDINVDETKVDDTKVEDTKVDEVTNVPTTEETKEVAPVVEDEKKSVKKATNSPK